MNKIVVEMIKIGEIENIGDSLHNRRENNFKQRDDQIAEITELAVNSGMRLYVNQYKYEGLSNMCYTGNRYSLSTCSGERQPRGLIGKRL